jgi:putative membrane protein
MQFLKTLFWVVVAIVVVLFAKANWFSVSVKLWGGLEADVKVPVILFIGFAIGFLPTFVLHRARIWSLKRRMEPLERNLKVQSPASTTPSAATAQGAPDAPPVGERVATDSRAWPTS